MTKKNPPAPAIHYRVEAADPHRPPVSRHADRAAPCRGAARDACRRGFRAATWCVNLRRTCKDCGHTRAAMRWTWRKTTNAAGTVAATPGALWSCATRCMPTTRPCAPPGWMPRAASSMAPACACGSMARLMAPHTLEVCPPKGTTDWSVATGLTARRRQCPWLWHLPRRRLRRTGGLPGGNGRVLERRVQGLRRAAPFRGRGRRAVL